ncbi:MAG: DUF5333 domain-containing protein [Alphaproteobacteria bacterium]|nr:DUF5333 domain-containing protein [Alphaproteobacteria bacterium]
MKPQLIKSLAIGLAAFAVMGASHTNPVLPPAAPTSTTTDSTLVKPGIKDNAEIFSRLLTVAIGSEIRDNCDTISARKFTVMFYVLGVMNYARKQGFSMDDMDAYRNTKSEQKRLSAATYAYLDKNGVNRDDPASYCPLGRTEIKNKSQIGKLLKSR